MEADHLCFLFSKKDSAMIRSEMELHSWDEALHAKAIDYLTKGWIDESVINDQKSHNCRPVRKEHIVEAEKKERKLKQQ